MNSHLVSIFYWVGQLVVAGFLLGACSLSGPLREVVKASKFSMGRAPKNWSVFSSAGVADSQGADRVYRDRESSAMIAVNSVCYRYESTSLERLARQYESGLKDPETLSEEEFTVDGRRGVKLHLRGSFDGVASEILVIVLRKNDCLFDFSLTGVSPLPAATVADFNQWVRGFSYSTKTEESKK